MALAQVLGILSAGSGQGQVGIRGAVLSGVDASNSSTWHLSAQGLDSDLAFVAGIRPSEDGRELVSWWTHIECPEPGLDVSLD